jgi:hypothetical protein
MTENFHDLAFLTRTRSQKSRRIVMISMERDLQLSTGS